MMIALQVGTKGNSAGNPVNRWLLHRDNLCRDESQASIPIVLLHVASTPLSSRLVMAKLPHFRWVRDPVAIRGFSARIRALANPVEVRDVVSALCFDHLDPAGREITDIGNFQRRNAAFTVRLDRQANTSAGAANLQIQVNNAALARIRRNQNEGTTIAQVLVPPVVFRAASSCHEQNVRTHLVNVARSALLASYDSLGFQHSVVEG
jgi:hypothetical protein